MSYGALYDARTGATRPWYSPGTETAGGGVRTRLVAYRSHDGTTVQMFIVAPEAAPDRPRPAILTGYGGFGVSMTPGYSPQALAWARAGGVFAVACLRGGGEEGEAWHRAGRKENKRNVFDDFDSAADCLVQTGWTTREQLGIIGSSNGGLLMGAALTQHPEKYAAVVCMSALLDMIRYERSGFGPSTEAPKTRPSSARCSPIPRITMSSRKQCIRRCSSPWRTGIPE